MNELKKLKEQIEQELANSKEITATYKKYDDEAITGNCSGYEAALETVLDMIAIIEYGCPVVISSSKRAHIIANDMEMGKYYTLEKHLSGYLIKYVNTNIFVDADYKEWKYENQRWIKHEEV